MHACYCDDTQTQTISKVAFPNAPTIPPILQNIQNNSYLTLIFLLLK